MIKLGSDRSRYFSVEYDTLNDGTIIGLIVNDSNTRFCITRNNFETVDYYTTKTVIKYANKNDKYRRNFRIPTVFEWKIIFEHLTEINNLLYNGKDCEPLILCDKYWTSTFETNEKHIYKTFGLSEPIVVKSPDVTGVYVAIPSYLTSFKGKPVIAGPNMSSFEVEDFYKRCNLRCLY